MLPPESLFSIRQLVRSPRHVTGGTLALGLGMALTTAFFIVFDALFLRPLPFDRNSVLAQVEAQTPGLAEDSPRLSARQFIAVQSAEDAFDGIAGFQAFSGTTVLGSSGDARPVISARVTGNFFRVLGVRPLLGRDFSDDMDRATDAPEVLLSSKLWNTKFAGDRAVVGTTVSINGTPHLVIGIVPDRMGYPRWADLWLPLSQRALSHEAAIDADGTWPSYEVIGRLSRTTALASAKARLTVVNSQILQSQSTPVRLTAIPLAKRIARDYAEQLRIWAALVIVVILISALNFGTTLLARGLGRRRELGVRAALGASTARLSMLLLVEAAELAAISGIIAIVLGFWFVSFASYWFPDAAIAMSWTDAMRVAVTALAGTVVIGLTFAVPPALELARVPINEVLQGTTPGPSRRDLRAQRALVTLQLSLATTCVATAAALAMANSRTSKLGPGYDFSNVVTGGALVFGFDAAQRSSIHLQQQLASLPHITHAAVLTDPTNGAHAALRTDNSTRRLTVEWSDVAPAFFEVTGIRAVAGRLPTDAEIGSRAPVVVLSASLADLLMGASHRKVGSRIQLSSGARSQWYTVIGIVPDFRKGPTFGTKDTPVYTFQGLDFSRSARFFLRTDGEPSRVLSEIRKQMSKLEVDATLSDLRPVRTDVDQWTAPLRRRSTFLLLIATLSLSLATLGVYNLTSYLAQSREREIGIRLALGAPRTDVLWAATGDLLWMLLAGFILGILVSARAASVLNALISSSPQNDILVRFDLRPTLVACATLTVVGVVGTLAPVRRALRSDVLRVIHHS